MLRDIWGRNRSFWTGVICGFRRLVNEILQQLAFQQQKLHVTMETYYQKISWEDNTKMDHKNKDMSVLKGLIWLGMGSSDGLL
jgi:hypothetical protein